jgi:hypothetical protein
MWCSAQTLSEDFNRTMPVATLAVIRSSSAYPQIASEHLLRPNSLIASANQTVKVRGAQEPKLTIARHGKTGRGARPIDGCPRVVEPTHMGVAGGETELSSPSVWILLDHEEQSRHSLFEASRKKNVQCLL